MEFKNNFHGANHFVTFISIAFVGFQKVDHKQCLQQTFGICDSNSCKSSLQL